MPSGTDYPIALNPWQCAEDALRHAMEAIAEAKALTANQWDSLGCCRERAEVEAKRAAKILKSIKFLHGGL